MAIERIVATTVGNKEVGFRPALRIGSKTYIKSFDEFLSNEDHMANIANTDLGFISSVIEQLLALGGYNPVV